jgi:O-succinylbenzoic acid--CoA ligase
MPQLVALDLPAGNQFLAAALAIWDRGDAIFPLDQRLPAVAQFDVISAMAPASIIGPTGSETSLPDSRPVRDGDALVIATSGSSGSPKGVVHTHLSIKASADASNARLKCTKEHHWLVCLPISHVGGLSVITRALQSQSMLTMHPGFDATQVTEAASNGVTHVSLVPTALQRIDPAIFNTILLGGSSTPPTLPPNVVTTYGMTETFGGVFYNGESLDGVELAIIDGQIHLRGPMLMRAYRDEQTPLTAEGWLPTGDAGSIVNGKLHVDGRISELIISGGENIWPNAVEQVIIQHPLVSAVAVAGVPDNEWGERVVAWVVPQEATRPPTLEVLREFVAQQLPKFYCPKEVNILPALPKTTLGKTDKRALIAQ